MARKEMSLRHAKRERYTLVGKSDDGMCSISDAEGRVARVKAEWLDIDGQVCWAGSFRKAIHIQNVEWTKGEVKA